MIFRDPAFEQNKRHAIHRWVPWIAGFSADFVVDALRRYLPDGAGRNTCVLDPFAGVGTTLVESIRHGHNAIGFEINPFAALAARVKCTAFLLDPASVRAHIVAFEQRARRITEAIDQAWACGDDLARLLPAPASRPPAAFRSRVPFFSPAVERKVLHCLDLIHAVPDPQVRDLMLLAFGSILVHVSNYSYEPSLGSRSAVGKADVLNADVAGLLSARLYDMEHDIIVYRRDMMQFQPFPEGKVINDDSRQVRHILPDSSIDIVITSPPYLNPLEKINLAKSIVQELLSQNIHPLPPPIFEGAGVYALYYSGSHDLYASLALSSGKEEKPIYVGKAVPPGARIGGYGLNTPPGAVLFNRLREHALSIDQAEDLDLTDFRCRYLVVDDIWIPLAETLLIEMYQPVWNTIVSGFGNHAPGKGRHKQQRSAWDTLHPGRPWAAKLQDHPKTRDHIKEEVRQSLRDQ